jgi:hypothetical protein
MGVRSFGQSCPTSHFNELQIAQQRIQQLLVVGFTIALDHSDSGTGARAIRISWLVKPETVLIFLVKIIIVLAAGDHI